MKLQREDIHPLQDTCPYLLLLMCMEVARFSKSSAIFLHILMPMVFVPLPIGFVAIS